MKKLNPYLKFNDGLCREAMHFYKDCFGGKLTFMTVGESPMAVDMPAEDHDLVMHSALTIGTGKAERKGEKGEKSENGGLTFYGSDMMRDMAVVGDNVGVALECDSEKELDTLFSKLSAEGEAFMEPDMAYWGAYFGMLTDKYGVEWMLSCRKEEGNMAHDKSQKKARQNKSREKPMK